MASNEADRREDVPTEGAWIYLSGPMQVPDQEESVALYDRLSEACADYGWHVYRPYSEILARESGEDSLAPRLRHALGQADLCVFYIGKPSSGVGTEAAWATEHKRPVVAMYLRGEKPSPLLCDLLDGYERARVLACNDPDDCATKLQGVLADPGWQDIIRLAGAEIADEPF